MHRGIIALVIALLVLGSVAGYFLISHEDIATETMAEWQTYQNKEYGFEFQYPHTLISKDVTRTSPAEYLEVFLIQEEEQNIFVRIAARLSFRMPTEKKQELVLRFMAAKGPFGIGPAEQQEIVTLNGISFTRIHRVDTDMPSDASLLYVAPGNSVTVSTSPEIQALTEQILSTFRFTK